MLNSASAKWLEVWKVTLVQKEQKLTLSQILRGPDFLLFLFPTHPRNLRPCRFFPCASQSCQHSGRWPLQPPQDLCWGSAAPGAAPLLSVLFKDPFFWRQSFLKVFAKVCLQNLQFEEGRKDEVRVQITSNSSPRFLAPHMIISFHRGVACAGRGRGMVVTPPMKRDQNIFPSSCLQFLYFHLHLYIHLSCAYHLYIHLSKRHIWFPARASGSSRSGLFYTSAKLRREYITQCRTVVSEKLQVWGNS